MTRDGINEQTGDEHGESDQYPRDATMVEAVIAVVRSRDLCGNEYESAADAYADRGYRMTRDEWAEVLAVANAKWDLSRQAAGVRIG